MNLLSVLVEVKPGELEDLVRCLTEIQADFERNDFLQLARSQLTHFARFTILPDSDRGDRLLFTADHDGPAEVYLQELVDLSPDLNGIWGRCVGYDRSVGFLGFARDHIVPSRGTYVAFPHENLQTIRDKIAIREQIEDLCNLDEFTAFVEDPGVTRPLQRIAALRRRTTWSRQVRNWGERAYARAAHGFHQAVLGAFLFAAKGVIADLEARSYPRVTSYCGAAVIPPDTDPGVIAGQTSFTVFARVKHGRAIVLRVLFVVTRLLARYGYPPGNFADVFTLHSFRWLLLDGGKNLVFQSTFDGSWENYMGDFIDKIVWALDFLYMNTEGYPAAGMREVEKFKDWIREHQPLSTVVYNAYPHETVLNLIRDRRIADGLAAMMDPPRVLDWLGDL